MLAAAQVGAVAVAGLLALLLGRGEDVLRDLVAEARRPRQRLGARFLQQALSVRLRQPQHAAARAAGPLLDLAGREDGVDRLLGRSPDLRSPFAEAAPVPLGAVAVRVGHAARVGPAIAPAQRPLADGDALPVAHDGRAPGRGRHGDRALDVLERRRVPGSPEGDAAVEIDGGLLAGGHLVGLARQRDEHRFLLAEEDALPAALALLEGAGAYRHRLRDRRSVEVGERHGPPLAQSHHGPPLDDPDAHLDARLVARLPHARRHDGAPAMLAHAAVLLADDERLLGVPGYRGPAAVRREDRGRAPEEREHVRAGGDPRLLVGLAEPLGVQAVRAGQARREHVRLQDLARVRADRLAGVADPADSYGLGRPALDSHADVAALRPIAALPAERGVHAGLLAPRYRRVAALVPQQRHRHAAPHQL